VTFVELAISGLLLIEMEPLQAEGGFTAATSFSRSEFARHSLEPRVAQCSVSFNHRRGTLRGMHYQAEPSPEAKLVRCTRGAIHDVVIDMRPGSKTFLRHVAVELNEENRRSLYVPELCAHGYQTLADDTEVAYQVSDYYSPACERGHRYDDPAFGITWPLPITELSRKDASWPLLRLGSRALSSDRHGGARG
jgi:dTDP-4-dehydrorhamnose 3,5-epimerase